MLGDRPNKKHITHLISAQVTQCNDYCVAGLLSFGCQSLPEQRDSDLIESQRFWCPITTAGNSKTGSSRCHDNHRTKSHFVAQDVRYIIFQERQILSDTKMVRTLCGLWRIVFDVCCSMQSIVSVHQSRGRQPYKIELRAAQSC